MPNSRLGTGPNLKKIKKPRVATTMTAIDASMYCPTLIRTAGFSQPLDENLATGQQPKDAIDAGRGAAAALHAIASECRRCPLLPPCAS